MAGSWPPISLKIKIVYPIAWPFVDSGKMSATQTRNGLKLKRFLFKTLVVLCWLKINFLGPRGTLPTISNVV